MSDARFKTGMFIAVALVAFALAMLWMYGALNQPLHVEQITAPGTHFHDGGWGAWLPTIVAGAVCIACVRAARRAWPTSS
jgi:hypothetical protein